MINNNKNLFNYILGSIMIYLCSNVYHLVDHTLLVRVSVWHAFSLSVYCRKMINRVKRSDRKEYCLCCMEQQIYDCDYVNNVLVEEKKYGIYLFNTKNSKQLCTSKTVPIRKKKKEFFPVRFNKRLGRNFLRSTNNSFEPFHNDRKCQLKNINKNFGIAS